MIKQIIKADMYHLIHTKAFYFTLLLGNIMFLLTDLNGSPIIVMSRCELPPVLNLDTGAYLIYYGLGTAINLCFMFLPIYMLLLSKDFSNKVIYNVLALGYSKKQYFVGKLFMVLFVTVILYCSVILVPMIIGTIVRGFGLQEEFSSYISKLLVTALFQILLLFLIGIFSLVLNIIFQKTSKFILIYMFGFFVTGYLFILSEVIDGFFISNKVFIQYWILTIINNQILTVRDYRTMGMLIIFYAVFASAIGIFLFEKRDLK